MKPVGSKPFRYFEHSEEKALAFTQQRLAEQPATPKQFFSRNWDIGQVYLDKWEREGKVVFAPSSARCARARKMMNLESRKFFEKRRQRERK